MVANEFTEIQYTIKYFGFADILGKIGGISASLKPILGILAPWLIILYLSTLANIILERNKSKYQNEIKNAYYEFKEFFNGSIYL